MIYGEETLTVDVSKGLWLSESNDVIPVGYCSEFTNLVVDGEGSVCIRGGIDNADDLVIDKTLLLAHPAVDSSPPDYMWNTSVYAFSVQNTAAGGPAFIVSYQRTASNSALFWITTRGNSPMTSQDMDVNTRKVLDLVQYRDRYYACNQDKTEIYQVSNFDPNYVGAITTTLLFTVPGVKGLVSIGDRIFGYSDTRIYYTDIAAAGGYSETWLKTNFATIPPAANGTVIHRIISHQNKLYIFTDNGVYIWLVEGPTTSWSLQLVNTQVKIFSKFSVALIKNLFILTDKTDIFYFDGSEITSMGAPMKKCFRECNSFSIHPFEDGFLFTGSHYIISGTDYVLDFATMTHPVDTYYFDGTVWSKFTYQASAYRSTGTMLATTFKYTMRQKDYPVSYALFLGQNLATDVLFSLTKYDGSSYNGDNQDDGDYLWSLKTRDITEPNWTVMKRAKDGVVAFRMHGVDSFNYGYSVNGGNYVSTAVNNIVDIPLDGNFTRRISLPQWFRRMSIRLNGNYLPGPRPDPKNPGLKIKAININWDTDEGPKQIDAVSG